jgi:hypothetical protein
MRPLVSFLLILLGLVAKPCAADADSTGRLVVTAGPLTGSIVLDGFP